MSFLFLSDIFFHFFRWWYYWIPQKTLMIFWELTDQENVDICLTMLLMTLQIRFVWFQVVLFRWSINLHMTQKHFETALPVLTFQVLINVMRLHTGVCAFTKVTKSNLFGALALLTPPHFYVNQINSTWLSLTTWDNNLTAKKCNALKSQMSVALCHEPVCLR